MATTGDGPEYLSAAETGLLGLSLQTDAAQSGISQAAVMPGWSGSALLGSLGDAQLGPMSPPGTVVPAASAPGSAAAMADATLPPPPPAAQLLLLGDARRASQDSDELQLAQLMLQAQKQQLQLRQQPGFVQNGGTAMLFFAKVPRTASKGQIQTLFAQYGDVVSLDLFSPFEGAPTSKGCGLVIMRSHSDAAAAAAALENYMWDGMHSTMVVKLMPSERPQGTQAELSGDAAAAAAAAAPHAAGELLSAPASQQQQAAAAAAPQQPAFVLQNAAAAVVAAGPAPPPALAASAAAAGPLSASFAGGSAGGGSGPSSGSWLHLPGPTVARRGFTGPVPLQRGINQPAGTMRVVQGVDLPPPGCGPDAYKLFVGNIPRAYSEAELLPIFTSVGPVQELVVLRDRATQESKGSAFVWYRTGADADKAQLSFNMQLVLQQRNGPSSRPLVVRPAAPGKHSQQAVGPLGATSMGATPGSFPRLQGMQAQQAYGVAAPQQASMLSVSDPMGAVSVQQGSYGFAPATLMPQAAYLQQQAQAQQQVQQQQHLLSVQPASCQPASLYGMPLLLSVSEAAPNSAYQLVPVQAMQQVQVQQQQQVQPQQQQAFGAGAFDLGTGYAASPPTLTYAPVMQQQQQQASGLGAVSLVPTAVSSQSLPAVQHAGTAAMLQPQTGGALMGSGGGVGSSSSSGGGALAAAPVATYHQQSNGQHVLTVPLRPEQLNSINTQLSSVAAMTGAAITAEHNFACGSLALRVTASDQQQLSQAWQIIQGVVTQQQQHGSLPLQVPDGLL